MPYVLPSPNKCTTCNISITRGARFCVKHVPRTKEWRLAMSKSIRATARKQIDDGTRKILKGKEHGMWKGGRISLNGYVFIHMPEHPNSHKSTGYIAEHRVIMERFIGRYLDKSEQVHHKNKNKTDNDISNLVLMTATDHMSEHAKNKKRDTFGRFIHYNP